MHLRSFFFVNSAAPLLLLRYRHLCLSQCTRYPVNGHFGAFIHEFWFRAASDAGPCQARNADLKTGFEQGELAYAGAVATRDARFMAGPRHGAGGARRYGAGHADESECAATCAASAIAGGTRSGR